MGSSPTTSTKKSRSNERDFFYFLRICFPPQWWNTSLTLRGVRFARLRADASDSKSDVGDYMWVTGLQVEITLYKLASIPIPSLRSLHVLPPAPKGLVQTNETFFISLRICFPPQWCNTSLALRGVRFARLRADASDSKSDVGNCLSP